jgi:histidinol-phosphate aminotransferase
LIYPQLLIPRHIRELQPYVAGKTLQEVIRDYNPSRISKLASNENRLGASPLAIEAAKASFTSIMNYPDPTAGELRDRIASKLNVKRENVIAASGSEGVMSLVMRAFFHDHEEALTAAATFIGFVVLVNARGVRLRSVPLTHDYRFDLPALADAITPETKIIYLANPNNPTGTYFSRAEFEAFMTRVPSHVLVLLDEAYVEYTEGIDDFPDSLQYRLDNVITLRTFSKAYGLAGLRVGYGVGQEDLIANLIKVKLPFEPSSPAQAAALAAIDDEEFLAESLEIVRAGKQRLYDFLDHNSIRYVKSVANSVMIIFDTEQLAIDYTEMMLRNGVVLRRLPAFGLPNCVRITIGLPDEMNHFEESHLVVIGDQGTVKMDLKK